MGWGTPRASVPQPKPQPLPQLDDGPPLSKKAAAALRAKHAPLDDSQIEWIGDESPRASAKGEIEWAKLKSKKGWTNDALNLVFYEFLQSKGLFEDLVKFAQRRK